MAKATAKSNVAISKVLAMNTSDDPSVVFHFGPVGAGSQQVELYVYSDNSSAVLIYGIPGSIGPLVLTFAPETTQEFVWSTVQSTIASLVG